MAGSVDDNLEAHGKLIHTCATASVTLVDGKSFRWSL